MAKPSTSPPTLPDHDAKRQAPDDKIVTVVPASTAPPAEKTASADASLLLNCIAFFIFGLSNNVTYVVFFSAAADFLAEDKSIPKSLVILINIVPSMCLKLVCPYVLPLFSYRCKILVTACVSLAALQIVAWSSSIPMRLAGIGLASAGSGFGECVFLSLSSYYSDREISLWSSGTGGAGLVGSVLYFVLSTVLELPFYLSMCLISCFPLAMMVFYQWVLRSPRRPKQADPASAGPRPKLPCSDASALRSLASQLRLISPLLVPYILPLFVVYFMEYLNMSIMYTVLFPLSETPFQYYEEEFRTYSVMYQIGVFVSRSSLTFAPIGQIWILATLQTATLLVFLLDAVLRFIPSIYVAFVLLFWVGLLGGSAYVNTYANIQRRVHPAGLEFSMAATGVADSIGISLAALVSVFLEPALCSQNALCRAHTKG